MTSTKLADASSVVGTCPEGFPLPLRASTCALTSSGSSRKVGGNQDVGAGVHGEGAPASANCVAARQDLSLGMSPLPAGTEVRAGQPAPPTTTEQSRERTPAGSSNMEVAA